MVTISSNVAYYRSILDIGEVRPDISSILLVAGIAFGVIALFVATKDYLSSRSIKD